MSASGPDGSSLLRPEIQAQLLPEELAALGDLVQSSQEQNDQLEAMMEELGRLRGQSRALGTQAATFKQRAEAAERSAETTATSYQNQIDELQRALDQVDRAAVTARIEDGPADDEDRETLPGAARRARPALLSTPPGTRAPGLEDDEEIEIEIDLEDEDDGPSYSAPWEGLGAPGAFPFAQAQSGMRLQAKLIAEVALTAAQGAVTGDVSEMTEGGVFVATWDVRHGANQIALSLPLGDGQPVIAAGTVLWHRTDEDGTTTGCGVSFDGLDDDVVEQLRELIDALQGPSPDEELPTMSENTTDSD